MYLREWTPESISIWTVIFVGGQKEKFLGFFINVSEGGPLFNVIKRKIFVPSKSFSGNSSANNAGGKSLRGL